MDTSVVTYVTFDADNAAYTVNCMSDFDPAFPNAYQERYAAIDEWYLRAKQRVSSEYVNDGRALCSNAELAKTEFFNDFLNPYGLLHECAAVLDLSDSSVHALTLLRTRQQEEFSANDLSLLRRFVPHIKRAARLHRRFTDLKASSGTDQLLMEQVNFGVILLRQDGSVVIANKAAERLCNGDGLRLSRRGLRATHSAQDAELQLLLQRISRPSLSSEAPPAVVVRRKSGDPLLISAGTLARGFYSAQQPTIVFIQDPARRTPPPAELFAKLYGLTPAEIRLSSLLIQGHSISEAAETLGISRNTTKTQAKSIYAKTGVRSQAQLVARAFSLGLA